MQYKPCPVCDETEDNFTQPFDQNGIDYVVCQGCGLRVDEDSWNFLPRPVKHSVPIMLGHLDCVVSSLKSAQESIEDALTSVESFKKIKD